MEEAAKAELFPEAVEEAELLTGSPADSLASTEAVVLSLVILLSASFEESDCVGVLEAAGVLPHPPASRENVSRAVAHARIYFL